MIKNAFKNSALRSRAQQFGRLVRHSAVTPRTGEVRRPQLVSNGELGVTFIGHASFFLQIGVQNVLVDPNFARWLFVLKRLRQPGLRIADLPPIDLVLITHAHFDHLHRSRWMVPMHYGTFRLSHEPMEEPLQLLAKEAQSAGIKDRVVVLEEGVTKFF